MVRHAVRAMLILRASKQEDGYAKVSQGRSIFWKVDPLTTEAPTAVVKFPGR
jgi:hypothetical protein